MTSVPQRPTDPRQGRPSRSATVRWLKRRLYDGRESRYWALVHARTAGASRILAFGAGRGAKEFDLRGPGREVVAVDVDQDVLENPWVDRAVVYDGGRLPFPDASFDMSCSQSVIEHLADPAHTFAELAVGLKVRTKHAHADVLRFTTGRPERDVFPTFYRANTRRRLRKLLTAAGFIEAELHVHLRGAGYLEFSLPTYLVGVLYERIVNASGLLEDLRGAIVGDFIRAPRP